MALSLHMTKSATDVMHEIILSAVTEALDALKSASRGMPNTLLRDINAIHPNAAFADLPRELQTAISANVRAAFNRLLKEGYSVSQGPPAPARAPSTTSPAPGNRRPPRPDGPRRDGPRRDGPRRDGPPREGQRPGPRPPRKPKPSGPNTR
jgi:hypothetical protein